jgi:hypothetical protein
MIGQAIGYGVPPERIPFETEQWRDHHRAKGDVVKDAAASWRTWMRNAATFAARDRASPNGPRTIGRATKIDAPTTTTITGRVDQDDLNRRLAEVEQRQASRAVIAD